MNRELIVFLVAIFIMAIPSTVHSDSTNAARRRYDPETVKITRWLDPTTRPITYEEYLGSRDFADSPNIRLLRSPLVNNDGTIDIIVNENLYPQIEGALDTFMTDLQIEGYSINFYTANETLSPVNLRNLLRLDWLTFEMEGVIFIGDLAVPWYEMDEPPDWGGHHVEFPCDLYFMDLDGTWDDSDLDGMFDNHGGSLLADIWVGRLVSSTLQYHGATEVSAMRNYFDKNHRYRAGDLRLDDHGLAFIDNDWNIYGWGYDVALAYPNTDSVIDIYETCRANYIALLQEDSNNRYEHLLICSHSSAFDHYIYYNQYNYELFHNYEIESFMMQSLTYNLFACSNSRYVEMDNMGGWYIFETEYGLLSIGSTKTGSMLCFDDFYFPLGQGSTFGEAFLLWSQLDMESCAGGISRPWFYGMCIQGDPTLKLARFQDPIVYCDYITGDINGSDSYNGLDITYGVDYFKGGSQPAYECECRPGDTWYVSGDVNGSCSYNGLDITYGVAFFKGGPDPVPCEDCPPVGAVTLIGEPHDMKIAPERK